MIIWNKKFYIVLQFNTNFEYTLMPQKCFNKVYYDKYSNAYLKVDSKVIVDTKVVKKSLTTSTRIRYLPFLFFYQDNLSKLLILGKIPHLSKFQFNLLIVDLFGDKWVLFTSHTWIFKNKNLRHTSRRIAHLKISSIVVCFNSCYFTTPSRILDTRSTW